MRQYCAHDHQKRLRQPGFRVLMSGKRHCYDMFAFASLVKPSKPG